MLNWIKSLKKKVSKSKRARSVPPSARRSSKNKAKGKANSKIKSSTTASSTARSLGSHNVAVLSRGEHTISRDNIDDHALKVLYRLHKAG